MYKTVGFSESHQYYTYETDPITRVPRSQHKTDEYLEQYLTLDKEEFFKVIIQDVYDSSFSIRADEIRERRNIEKLSSCPGYLIISKINKQKEILGELFSKGVNVNSSLLAVLNFNSTLNLDDLDQMLSDYLFYVKYYSDEYFSNPKYRKKRQH